MRGKIVKAAYFREQGLAVFLDKLRSQGWLNLFTNTQLGCSAPELAEFYARISVIEGTVTSEVNGVKIVFDDQKVRGNFRDSSCRVLHLCLGGQILAW